MDYPTLRKDTDAVSDRFRSRIRMRLSGIIQDAHTYLKDSVVIEVIREELQKLDSVPSQTTGTKLEDEDEEEDFT